MRQKGVTEVIAVVMLIVIVMVIVGFFALWFTRTTNNVKASVGSDMKNTAIIREQTIRIVSVTQVGIGPASISVAASGRQGVNVSTITLYVDSAQKNCTWTRDFIPPGSTQTCIAQFICPVGVRMTAPGNEDETNC